MHDPKGTHIAGTCRTSSCDRPSHVNGYCKKCFEIKKEEILTNSLLKIVDGLNNLNSKIENLENKFVNAMCNQVTSQQTINPVPPPTPTHTPNDDKKKYKKQRPVESDETFVPQIDIPEADVKTTKKRQSHISVNDLQGVASKLKKMKE